jgi:spore coat polysaccharide biosynthesis protein SpsF
LNLGIIIQARMGSKRLPGKVLKKIAGKTLLDHVLDRLNLLMLPNEVVVATSIEKEDDLIANHCLIRGTKVFRGSNVDVLDRYFKCASEFYFHNIVRLTADNPFTDIEELYKLILLHIDQGNDYTHSFGQLPLGVGAEIFTYSALKISAEKGYKNNHREHVNEYITENIQFFKVGVLQIQESKKNPELRLTVDTESDYQRVCNLAESFTNKRIATKEAIKQCLPFV